MKRMLTLLAALMLLLTAIPASAESLFSLLPTSQTDPIPNYGLMAGVDPASEETLEDGSTRYHYANVAAQSFLDFGTLLGEKGYAIDPNSMKVEGSAQTMNLVKDDIVFTITYDQVRLTLVVTYPAGANIEVYEEPDPFEGYVELPYKQEVQVKASSFQGSFEVLSYDMKASFQSDYSSSSSERPCVVIWAYNKGTKSVYMKNIIRNVKLHYINDDNHYTYSAGCYATQSKTGNYGWQLYARYLSTDSFGYIDSLNSEKIYAFASDVPVAVRTATDGTLAVTFTFIPTNTNYVVYLRRPAQ